MEKVEYIGCFFDPQEMKKHVNGIERTALYRTISSPHVTFVYNPSSIPKEMLGQEVTVQAEGYGNDGENEALQVSFLKLPAGLEALAAGIPVPHITLSVSRQGKPVNSRYLTFKPIAPFALTGIFGAMDEDGVLHT